MVTSMADFQKKIDSIKGPVLVDFYATWCQPCKVLDKLLPTIEGATILKVDVNKAADVASAFMVSTVPTVLCFNNGRVCGGETGLRPKSKYEELIQNGLEAA